MLIPIILRSDKPMVSVATGQNEYWPIYKIGDIQKHLDHMHVMSPMMSWSQCKNLVKWSFFFLVSMQ